MKRKKISESREEYRKGGKYQSYRSLKIKKILERRKEE